MKKKSGFFKEKICVTVSSRDCTHRAPVCFTMRRGGSVSIAMLLTAVVAFCTYTAVDALLRENTLAGVVNSLNFKIEQQSGQISEYEKQISELEQEQQ